MKRPVCIRNLSVLFVFCLIWAQLGAAASAQQAAPTRFQQEQDAVNANTVAIMAAGRSGAYIQLVEDLQNVLDDTTGNELRILPIIGRGGAQNLRDVLLLKGVDMALTESDYFTYFKNKDPQLYGNIDKLINYIAKLYNPEFHCMASKNIKSYEDLRGKKVNFWKRLSATDIAAQTIFRILDVQVEPVYLDQELANLQLKKGEIAAACRMAGAPLPAFTSMKAEDGLHFVPISPENPNYSKLLEVYLPSSLTSESYPQVISSDQPVPTVSTSVVLVSYAWPKDSERYRRVANFTKKFFDNFDKFLKEPRNEKWQNVNLATNVPGWTRFPAADEWLATNKKAPTNDMKAAFDRFLSSVQSKQLVDLSDEQKGELYENFLNWYNNAQRQN